MAVGPGPKGCQKLGFHPPQLGFDYVFDTLVGADLVIMEVGWGAFDHGGAMAAGGCRRRGAEVA